MDKAFTVGRSKRRTTAGLMATPVLLLRTSPLLNYQLHPHNPVMETEFSISIRSNCDIAFVAPHAICYGATRGLFRFHCVGRFPISFRRRRQILAASFEHHARGLVRCPRIQNLLEETCR